MELQWGQQRDSQSVLLWGTQMELQWDARREHRSAEQKGGQWGNWKVYWKERLLADVSEGRLAVQKVTWTAYS